MKLHILISLLLLLGTVFTQQTTISFLVQYEDQQQEDYIQLGLTVTAQGSSLVNVMDQARKSAQQIKQIATQFCQRHAKKKTDCKDIVDIGNYDIQPQYQTVKRQFKFQGFQVTHQVTIKVLAVDHISDLADTILKSNLAKIISFEWKPLEQSNMEEEAVKQGTAQGQQLCDQLGMHLGSIESVEQMTEQETQETAVYQFEVKCLPGKKAKKEQKEQPKADKKEDGGKQQKKQAKKQDKKQKKADDKKPAKADQL